jgi:lipoprotein YgeR
MASEGHLEGGIRKSIERTLEEKMLSRLCVLMFCLMLVGGCTTMRGTPSMPVRTGGVYHRVERGETLWRLSQRYHIELDALVRVNNLKSSHRIKTGQLLWIPQTTAASTPARKTTVAATALKASARGFSWPVTGDVVAYFGTAAFGSTNRGIAIKAARGAPVRAARDGRVVFAERSMPGYGLTVIIDHGDDFYTVYAWNHELLVHVGQQVTRSTPIATAGTSGRANQSMVHFEVRRHATPQNPLHYLP